MSTKTSPVRTVLISGASIAGPALAHWLHRYGFTPTVVERAPELRSGGYKVDLRGEAVEVCERMGIMDEVRAHSTDMQLGAYVDADNRVVGEMPAAFFGGRVDGDDEIMRGDLARILYERTRDDVEYLFGDSIASLTEDSDGVLVTFENAPPRRFDLVVGADGMHSHTRRLVFGDEERFRRHLGAYISIFTAPNDLELDRREVYHVVVDKMVCAYSSQGQQTARNMFVFASPEIPYDHRDTAAQKRILHNTFAQNESWEIPRLLSHAASADDFYFDSISLIEMDRWSKGRVVLLGDAAHCVSPAAGQGTGLALIGAYTLAGELAASRGDFRQALDAYERHMRPGVEHTQDFARKFVTQMTVDRQWKIRLRLLMLRTLPKMPWRNLIAKKITEDVQKAAHVVPLKGYGAGRVAA
ncbi:FAD-dependent oxidoreductase [Streptomyces spiroverticillatus]|uniref:FAD-dependent oxidoreductase n=1 Tax=Streptomyces finlayi TaxID=67296 RepID=A0A919CC33_9ACTN|nr:FAD-dependent monooxygenase [Streptomyces finlayi]GHA20134.1 FAD-dependent oxidoreductase [Streptomyces spiroverticillatus]GHD02951.1 FAD-dependent oxidoreductase [Streptomyces finlayi]